MISLRFQENGTDQRRSIGPGEDDRSDQSKPSAITASSGAATCHFLELPAELRNIIYELLLVPNADKLLRVHHVLEWQYREWKLADYLFEPPILRASHEIRNEALPLFYGLNTLRFYGDHSRALPTAISKNMDKIKRFNVPICAGTSLDAQIDNGIEYYFSKFNLEGFYEKLGKHYIDLRAKVEASVNAVGLQSKLKMTPELYDKLFAVYAKYYYSYDTYRAFGV